MNGADVWVVQCGRGLCFALKTCQCLQISRNGVRQELQRHVAVQPRILGLIDHTHPAPAQFLQDTVVGNGLAYERISGRHGAAMLGCDVGQVNECQLGRHDNLRGKARTRVAPVFLSVLGLEKRAAGKIGISAVGHPSWASVNQSAPE
jgi:hypothetical protein